VDSTSTSTDVAFGLRFSLEDGADLRTNEAYIGRIEEFRAEQLRRMSQRQDALVASGMDPEAAQAAAEREGYDRARLDAIRDSLQDSSWNANSLDIAIGGLVTAADSTGADVLANRLNIWATLGRRVGPTGQLLLSGVAARIRDADTDSWTTQTSLAARFNPPWTPRHLST